MVYDYIDTINLPLTRYQKLRILVYYKRWHRPYLSSGQRAAIMVSTYKYLHFKIGIPLEDCKEVIDQIWYPKMELREL